MSSFTPLVAKQYEFDGDKVHIKFSRLKRKDMLKLMPSIQKMQSSDDDAVKSEAIGEMLAESLEFLPKYVKEINGLVDAEGTPVSIETVADDMYFVQLATEIVTDLMSESSLGMGADAKNG
jgi:hypothetical protein